MRAGTVRSPCCVTLAQRNVHGWEPESHAADQRHIELWAAKIRCPAGPSAQKCQKPLGPQYLIRSPERKYFLVKDLLHKNPLFPCDDKTKRLATTQELGLFKQYGQIFNHYPIPSGYIFSDKERGLQQMAGPHRATMSTSKSLSGIT